MNNSFFKKIIIFAGTSEGRKLCEFFSENNIPVTACVATDYGSVVLSDIRGINLKEGRLSPLEIQNEIKNFDIVIDATHPYAKNVSKNILDAITLYNKKHIRIIRPKLDVENIINFKTIEQACEFLNTVDGNVLITTGSNELLPFTKIKDFQKRLFLRVLPSVSSIEQCLKYGFLPSNLICMQGPFSEEINIALINQINAKYLVTKESGASGGFEQKISATVKTGSKAIVIGRPNEEVGLSLSQAIELFKNDFCIKSSAHFPLFFNLENKKIIVVGGGKIATRRVKTLLEYGCDITVIAPVVSNELFELKDIINLKIKEYEKSDINDALFVVAATNLENINLEISNYCKSKNILVNVVDNKELCDFYFPALFGNENISGGLISKNGNDHKLAKEQAKLLTDFLSRGN